MAKKERRLRAPFLRSIFDIESFLHFSVENVFVYCTLRISVEQLTSEVNVLCISVTLQFVDDRAIFKQTSIKVKSGS